MSVVLAGSLKISFLPSQVKAELDLLIRQGEAFLIGDAPGVDTSFQQYLHLQKCEDVLVFSSAGFIRNNLGDWKFRLIETPLKSSTSDRHSFKDRQMCLAASSGLMVWDTNSAGTLSNVIDLVGQGKECFVFNVPENELVRFDNPDSLNSWCEKYPEVTLEARKRLARYARRLAKRNGEEESQATLF